MRQSSHHNFFRGLFRFLNRSIVFLLTTSFSFVLNSVLLWLICQLVRQTFSSPAKLIKLHETLGERNHPLTRKNEQSNIKWALLPDIKKGMKMHLTTSFYPKRDACLRNCRPIAGLGELESLLSWIFSCEFNSRLRNGDCKYDCKWLFDLLKPFF